VRRDLPSWPFAANGRFGVVGGQSRQVELNNRSGWETTGNCRHRTLCPSRCVEAVSTTVRKTAQAVINPVRVARPVLFPRAPVPPSREVVGWLVTLILSASP
jgi:hypothetical protein